MPSGLPFPTSWNDIVALLSSPIFIAMLLSWFWDQVPFFQDEDNSDVLKIGIVLVSGLVWSILYAVFSPMGLPSTLAGWGGVLALGVSVGVSTQIFHKLLKNAPAWLLDLIAAIRGIDIGPINGAKSGSNTGLGGNQGLFGTAHGISARQLRRDAMEGLAVTTGTLQASLAMEAPHEAAHYPVSVPDFPPEERGA